MRSRGAANLRGRGDDQSHAAPHWGPRARRFLGIAAVLQKQSSLLGATPAIYLTVFGASVFASGLGVLIVCQRHFPVNIGAIAYAVAAGVLYAAGTGLVGLALWRYGTPISKLAPVLSVNVLVTVAAGLLLGEAQEVNEARLIVGAVLVLAGVFFVISS